MRIAGIAGQIYLAWLAPLVFTTAHAATLTVTNTANAGGGSLRTAIATANGNGVADTIVFNIPTSDAGYNATTGVFTITLGSALPPLTESGTTIDGTTQRTFTSNSNGASGGNPDFPGKSVGTGADGVVGTIDDPQLPFYDGPEIEIDANDRGIILDAQAGNTTIRHLALFNNPSSPYAVLISGGSGSLIEQCFIGMRADGTPPLATQRVNHAVELNGGSADIRDNFVAHAADQALQINEASVIEGNDIYANFPTSANDDGVAISRDVAVTLRRNRIDKMPAYAVETFEINGVYTLEDNTFSRCGQSAGTEQGCVRVFGDGNTVRQNVITGAVGAGIVVGRRNAAGDNSTNNLISKNSIYGNGGPGIDLDQTTLAGSANGDGVTANDGSLSSGGQNQDLDYPVLTSILRSATQLRLAGYVGAASSKISGAFTLEAFVADDDGNNNGEIEQGDTLNVPHGEGKTYIGNCAVVTSIATPDFDCTIAVPTTVTLDVGDDVTVTARLSTNSTSEFSANASAEHWASLVKRAYQLDGTPIASGSTLPAGLPVRFLVYIDNPAGIRSDVSVQDVLDPTFLYSPSSIRVDNTLTSSVTCPAGLCDEAAIFARVDGFGIDLGDGDAATPPVDGDVASYDAPTRTIDLGDESNPDNASLDIAADSVWAALITVVVE